MNTKYLAVRIFLYLAEVIKQQAMNPTFKKAKELARSKGLSLAELCRRADVQYPTVANWKRKEPMQFQIMRALEETASELEGKHYTVVAITDRGETRHKIWAFSSEEAEDKVRDSYDDFIHELTVSI